MLAVVEDYEQALEPLVVFSAHRAPIDTLARREGWEVITGDTQPEIGPGNAKEKRHAETKTIQQH